MFEFFSAVVAIFLLLTIAFPQLLVPNTGKKKKVGSSYWGVYGDAPNIDTPDESASIEVPRPARKAHPVYGSSMYASGKGTSLRR